MPLYPPTVAAHREAVHLAGLRDLLQAPHQGQHGKRNPLFQSQSHCHYHTWPMLVLPEPS